MSRGSDGRDTMLGEDLMRRGPVFPEVGNVSLLGESSIPSSGAQKPNGFGFGTDRKGGEKGQIIQEALS